MPNDIFIMLEKNLISPRIIREENPEVYGWRIEEFYYLYCIYIVYQCLNFALLSEYVIILLKNDKLK